MAKCKDKSCLNSAEIGHDYCDKHGGAPPKVQPIPDPMVVPMCDVPKNARISEAAMKLLKRIRALQGGSALRVENKYYPQHVLVTVKRYALADDLRIGVRINGEHSYLWRMSDEEIKAVQQKAAKLQTARAARKKK